MRGWMLMLALLARQAAGAAADPAEKDVLLFPNGEKLIGRLVRSNGATLLFRSDSVGDVTVAWSAILELRTARRFAVVEKAMRLGRHENASRIPQGALSADSQTITVDPGAGRTSERVAVKDAAHLIDEATFGRLIDRPGMLGGWKGSVTAGATLVEATQHGRTFTGAVRMARTIPAETWLQARNRTTFDFNGAYGVVTQPETPRLKTELYHLGIEHDVYFTGRLFVFGGTAFDHNISQGLDLRQKYGAGLGWTIAKRSNLALDVKASAAYLRQRFQAEPGQNLIGSTMAQTFSHRLRNGIALTQQISITPAWNNRNAYAAEGGASLTIPLYKRLSFTVGTIDTFINNPAPGSRKNSFQLTTGLTYLLP